MVEIIGLERMEMDEISNRIKSGAVFVYPTDTVYGLGCDAMNEDSVRRVLGMKRRPAGKPLSVAFSDLGQLSGFVELDDIGRRALAEKLPGPYTFIVGNKSLPRSVTAGLDSVGVRIPSLSRMRELIGRTGPIITTSANLSGEPPAKRLDGISNDILEATDFAIDCGFELPGRPSAVIDLRTGERLR